MSQHQMRIELDSPPVFRPSDTISGRVEVWLTAVEEIRGLELVLGWRITGKGEETGAAEVVELSGPGMLSPGFKRKFSFRAPGIPATYQGAQMSIQWLVGLYLKPRKGKEISTEVPIVISPTGEPLRPPVSGSPG